MNASGSSSVLALPVSAGVIAVTDRWFLRYGLPYRDLEELPAERRHHRSRHHLSLGYSGSRPNTSTPPGCAVMLPAAGGSPMRSISRWLAGGPICSGRPSSSVQVIDMLISQHRDTGPGRSPAVLHPGAVPARSCAARNSIAWLTRAFASSQGTVVVTSKNASADQHPQAMGRLSRARFATQSATQFDHALAGAGKPPTTRNHVARAQECAHQSSPDEYPPRDSSHT